MSQRVSGVALSYLLIVIRLVVTLAFTPMLVSSLGIEGYGLYVLVGALSAYLYILDFGMNDSVIRFFVAHENDIPERDRFLARMLGLFGLIGGVILAASYGLSHLAAPAFGANMTPYQIALLEDMILVTGLTAAVVVALNPVGALLSATESFVFLRSMEIAATLLATLVMVLVLRAGGDALDIVIVSAASMILQAMVRVTYAIVVLGGRVRLGLPDRATLARVVGYGAPIFLVMIAEVIFWRLDTLLIGAFLGAAPIAVFAIGVTFNKYFMSFATALSRVMTPEIIRQVDKAVDSAVLTHLMIRLSRIQAMFLLLILTGLIIFGQSFLTLWLGSEFACSYWVMVTILVPYALEMIGNTRNIILQVKGLYWYRASITLGMSLMNIPLTMVLLNTYGVVGAAISTAVALTLGYVLVAILLRVKVGMEMLRYWRETARGILPVALVLVGVGLWAETYIPASWGGLVVGSVLYTGVFSTAIYTLAASPDEQAFIKRLPQKFRKKTVANA